MMCRIEDAFGSGHRDIADVLNYEIIVLENIDIFECLSVNEVLPIQLRERMISCMNDKLTYGCIQQSTEELKIFIRQVIESLNESYGVNFSHCLWLCKKKCVRELYGKSAFDKIDYYEESDVILSDLGVCGKLYAYTYNPNPI